MRSYVLDEISAKDIGRIRDYLDENSERSSIEDLYWLDLDPSMLSGVQEEHRECQPYCLAIELGDHFVKFEFLVRSRVKHNCICFQYASTTQRSFVMDFADRLITELGVRT